MQVEISPRQSGKTTRLFTAAADFLRHNPDSKISLVSFRRSSLEDLKVIFREKLASLYAWDIGLEYPSPLIYNGVDDIISKRVKFKTNTKILRGEMEPDYWFVDEFAYMNLGNLFPYDSALPRQYYFNDRPILTNIWMCTTPGSNNETTDFVIDYCRQNAITINYNNPWTERRLEEEGGFEPYIREVVLGDWATYMRQKGFPIEGVGFNLISKKIKRHRFIS